MSMTNRIRAIGVVGAALLSVALAGNVEAAMVPYLEDFTSGHANWFNAAGGAPVGWSAAGGPDGGAYVVEPFNFVSSADGDLPLLFRAQDEFGSSGGAFEGDWVADGVTSLSYMVWQDTGASLIYYTRFSGPANSPGAVSVNVIPVPSEVWTAVTVPIPDPNFIFEGPFTFEQVFGDIGHIQVGFLVPGELAGVDQAFNFGLDKVNLLPEPASLVLLVLGLGATCARRRRV